MGRGRARNCSSNVWDTCSCRGESMVTRWQDKRGVWPAFTRLQSSWAHMWFPVSLETWNTPNMWPCLKEQSCMTCKYCGIVSNRESEIWRYLPVGVIDWIHLRSHSSRLLVTATSSDIGPRCSHWSPSPLFLQPSTLVFSTPLTYKVNKLHSLGLRWGKLLIMCPALMVALIKMSVAQTSVIAQAPFSTLIMSLVICGAVKILILL